nr:nucleotide exchange factor GrpE [uncultured Desulfobacter sp.]
MIDKLKQPVSGSRQPRGRRRNQDFSTDNDSDFDTENEENQYKGAKIVSPVDPDEQHMISKLENKKWVKLVDAICEFITEIDRHGGLDSEQPMIDAQMVINRLQEILIRNDVDVLDKKESFDNKKHESVPPGITPNGTSVDQISRFGFMIDNRVFLKAKVIVEK